MRELQATHSALMPKPSRNRLLALEPRYLFDGVAITDTPHDPLFQDAPQIPPGTTPRDTTQTTLFDATAAVDAAAANTTTREIVFIEDNVPDFQQLVADIRADVEIQVLDHTRDGLAQMAEILSVRSGLDAVHIVSHGSEASVQLGVLTLNAGNLNDYGDELQRIGQSLNIGGDILLYGCNIAKGADGTAFIQQIGALTHADVTASSDDTGTSNLGGDWALEYATGNIEASPFFTAQGAQSYQNLLATVDLSGQTGWTAVMYGLGQDPVGDSQAGAADTDIVGDVSHGSLYAAFDDNGTASTADDSIVFRMRIDNPTSTAPGSEYYGGVAIVGMDANLDGRVDLFMSVDGRNNGQAIKLFDPGTDANISPSTTSTSPLPTGWLPNNGVYAFSSSNYSVVAVSATTDTHWTGDNDLGSDGKIDAFVTWKISVADIATVLAKPSLTDRNGNYGPRGATGITGYNKDTVVQYVNFTQTQTGPINGDLNGVGASYDKNATFAVLGAITAPMSASNPVSAGPSLAITEPISGDGVINDAEDNSVTINGTSINLANATTISLSVSDGVNAAVTGSGTVSGNAWSVTGLNLSGLNDGTLTVTATYNDNNASTADPTDTASVLHDKTAPTITIAQQASALSGTPTFTGTTNLAVGSSITVTIDPDNNSGTANNIVYQVIVGSGGAWTLNTATATPASGTLPNGGLISYSKITATATDAAGNSATATAQNHPTVNSQSTNDTTPTVTGTWTNISGDTLTVTINGVTYSTGSTPALIVSGDTWSITPTAALAVNTYDVTATVTRSGAVLDTTTNELTITNTPVVAIDITGGATASGIDTTPVITGTSSNAGGYVIVRLDPSDDGNLSDAVTYSVTPIGDGSWSLDTGSATPISGTVPGGGFVGATGIRATDSTDAVADTQVLTVTTPTIAIGSITSTASTDGYGQVDNSGAAANWLNMTEDDAVTISGTASGASSVDLTITDANGHFVEYTDIAVSSGNWSKTGMNLSSLDNGVLTVTATVSGTAINATNSSVTHDKLAPRIFITSPSEIKKNGGVIYGGSELLSTQLTVTVRDSTDASTVWTGNVTTDVNGDWSVTTSGNLVSGSTGNVIVKVQPTSTATDTAKNIVQQVVLNPQYVAANASTTTISISTIAGDNVITSGEIASGVTISGTTTLTGTPTVSLSVTDGTTTVNPASVAASSGTWSTTLTLAQIKTLSNGPLTVTATAPDGTITISDIALPTLSLPSPTLTITDNTPTTATGDVTFTFTFSEAVTGFDATDVILGGGIGTKGTFSGSGAVYTLVVSPPSSSSGNIALSVASSVATATATGRNNIGDSDTQPFNTTGAAAAPTVTIDVDNLATDTTPVISGTTSLSPGAPIVITIDPDNDATTNNSVTYSATVQSDYTWSLDVGSATPTSGSLPADGLPTYAKITATATNAYGNSATATGIDKPTVISQTTNDNTPTVSGKWANISGDTLSVVVNGVTYSTANSNLTITGNNWSLTPTSSIADGTHSVAATVTRGATTKTDITGSELVIDTLGTVNITGGASVTVTDTTPVIAGTTAGLPDGTVLTLSLDTDNNGSYDLVYKATISSNAWSVDTGTATPYSGTFPASGLSGTIPLSATASDAAGNTGTDTQTLLVDVTPPVIAITSNSVTSDASPLITGTTDLPAGSIISVTINPGGSGNGNGDIFTYNVVVQQGGTWFIDTGLAANVGMRSDISGNTNTVTATGSDAAGNSATATGNVAIVANTPAITITDYLDWAGNNNGTMTAAEDDSVVVKGTTADVPAGSSLTITLTDGTTTITDTAIVQSGGAWQLAALNLSGMVNGTITATATYTDDTGNSYSDTASAIHDKAGTVSIDSISNDTGVLDDFITSDQTLIFTGSASANASVDLTLSGAGSFSTTVTANSSGVWTYNYTATTLAAGTYSLQAVSGATATQAIVIDTAAPAGPVTVTSQTTADTTPAISGTATVGAGETLTVTVNGNTYTVGDGMLSLAGTNWTLNLPAADALSPAVSGGFNGVYAVIATIKDVAGNSLSDGTSGELTIQDTTAPAIDLDPSNGASLNHSATSANGAAVSLDDNSDAATIVEASDKLNSIAITVGGLQDGASEKLIFGSTTVAADGSSGTQSDITVGGVRVNVTYAGGVFSVQKYNYADLTAAEAQAVIRDIRYQNMDGTIVVGNRTFAFATTDDAGNTSATATTTLNVTNIANTPPVIESGSNLVSLAAGNAGSLSDSLAYGTVMVLGTSSVATGSDSHGDYWQWTSTNDRGGGFTLDANIGDASVYTVAMRFSLNEVTNPNNGYIKLIDYDNRTMDDGFYLLNGRVNVWIGGDVGTGSTQFNANQVIDLIAVRDASGSFKVYLFESGVLNTTPQLSVTDSSGAIIPTILDGLARFGFFFDDPISATHEGASGGKLYSLKIWNRALDVSEIGTALTVYDNSTISPFSAATISDVNNDNVAVTIALDDAAKGVFTAASLTASGFSTSDSVTYTHAATTQAAATAAIRLLVFDPTDNRVAPGSSETTTFTITANDGAATTVNSTIQVASISVNDAPVISSNGGGTTAAISINEGTTAVTTVAASDADGSTPTYTISGGADSARFTINATTGVLAFTSAPDYENPTDSDTNNTYAVNVTATDGTNTDVQAITVTVLNLNDSAGFTLGAVSGNTTEAGGTATFTVALATQPTADVTVTVASSDTTEGTAAATLTFTNANWSTAQTVTVTGVDDTIDDGDIGYNVTLSAASSDGNYSGLSGTRSVTNTDNDAPPTLSINDVTVNEGAGTASFTVTRSGATGGTTTVDYATSNGTATAGADYTAASGSLSFAAGDTTKTVTVNITDDASVESGEGFTVTLSNIADATSSAESISDATGAGTITDNDTAGFTLGAVSGNTTEAGGTATFTVKLNTQPASDVTVTVGSADTTEGTVGPATLTFTNANWNSTQTVTVTGVDDTIDDGDIAYNVTLAAASSDGNYSNLSTSTNVTNADNDAPPTLAVSDVTASEGAGTASFTVTRSGATGGATTVDYATGDGTATAGSDYTAASGTLTFAAGETSKTITVNLTDDASTESSETINVTLSNINDTTSSAETIGDANGVGTITDNDSAPVISSNSGGATAAISINEGTTAVTTVVATDADGSTPTYAISGGADQAKFTIDASTGVLAFASAPDYGSPTDSDTNNTYVVNVTATDGTNTDVQAITVTVLNLNDSAPVISSNSGGATAAISINEGTTAVTTVAASDADGSTPTYTISGGADSARFTINATTGVLAFASAPDYENPTDSDTNNTYVVNVTATDGTNTDVQAITVTVLNLNDNPVVLTDSSAGVNIVAENATVGTTVGVTALGVDADSGTSVTYELTDTASNRFAINASTGVVTVNGALDYESATSHTITVKATSSDGSITSGDFVIVVLNLNDNPVVLTDSNADANTVAENATVGTTVGVTALGVDADSGTSVTYELTDTASNRFAINASTGVVTVNGALDYESATSHTITVKATSSDGNITSGDFAIAVSDYDEIAPDVAITSITIDTNAPGQNGDGTAPAITSITNDNSNASTTDVADNTATATQPITIDTNAPGQNGDGTAPAITSITNDQMLVFHGTAGANSAADASHNELILLAQLPIIPPAPVIDQPALKVQADAVIASVVQSAPAARADGASYIATAAADAAGDTSVRVVIRTVTPLVSQLLASGQGDTSTSVQLGSTDRGFPVERLQSTATKVDTVQDQQKGGDRLFVYNGLKNATLEAGQSIDYRVPKDAFGHTNTAAVVQLEASLSDGSPLPEWLDFDPTSGTFSGKPPANAGGLLEVKVTARDDQGREITSNFKVQIKGRNSQELPEKPAPEAPARIAPSPGADAGEHSVPDGTALRLASDKSLPAKRGTMPFSDQLKLSKRDQLVDRILFRQQTAARAAAAQRVPV